MNELVPTDYDQLPAFIQARYTLKEWMWLSDEAKTDLLRRETEPEHEEP